MPRRKRSPIERWLTGRGGRTDEIARIGLLLRGPALGVPLWLPQQLWPCSACLKLKSKKMDFSHYQGDMRNEPVCSDCRKDPLVRALPQVVGAKIEAILKRRGLVIRRRPALAEVGRLIEALALRPGRFTIAVVCDGPEEGASFLEDMAVSLQHEMHIHSVGRDYVNFDVPWGRMIALDPQSNWSGWKVDVLYDLRGAR